MSRRPVASVVAAVVLASLLAGCTDDKSEPHSSGAENPQIAVLRGLPFGEAGLAVVTEVLGAAGVGVFEDSSGVPAGSVVRVLRWQVRNLAVEAANGGGVPGEALNALVPVRQGVPPVPYLVAAWVKSYDSAGARFSRDLLGVQDLRNANRIVFPSLVIALFLADATAGMKPSGTPKAGSLAADSTEAGSFALAGAQGVCSFAATFIQHAIADVAALAKVDTSGGGFFGFLGKIWNTAVDLAAAAVQGLITTFTQPVVSLVTDVFGVLAMVMQLSSFLVKWRADLRPEPSHSSFGVGDQIVTGQFTLTVTQNQLPIPELIVDCAGAFGVDLRNAGSAAGSKVTWTAGRTDLSTPTTADDTLAPDKTARYRYQNRQESAELAKSSLSESPALIVKADVHRNDIQKARELFEHLLLNNIDSNIRPIVETIVAPLRAQADQQLRAITDVTATARTFITYHLPDSKTPTPSTPDGGGKKAMVPGSCPSAVLAEFGYASVGSQPVDGVLICVYVARRAELGVAITDRKATAHVCPDAEPVAVPGAEAAWIDNGSCGTPAVIAVVSNGTLKVTGGDGGRDEIIAIARRILS